MFGLSWDQIILILLAGLFLLGPERIPTALKWIMDSLRKVRSFAAGAQSEMRTQLGPELDELRRQIAELQSLKEIKELRDLRELDPRRMVGKTILGDEFSGGMKGFLGLSNEGPDAAAAAGAAAAGTAGGAAAAASASSGTATNGTPPIGTTSNSAAESAPAAPAAGAPAPSASQWGDAT